MRIRKPQQLRVDDSGSVLLPFLDAVVECKTASPGDPREPDNCDVTMVYSASKFRASVNWLNKLRAAKGFPVEPDISIEDFLSSRSSVSPRESQAGSPTLDASHDDKPEAGCVENLDVQCSRTFTRGVEQVYERSGERQRRAVNSGPFKTGDFNIPNGSLCPAALRSGRNAATESECGRSSVTEAPCGLRISGENHSAKYSAGGKDHKEENSSVNLSTQSRRSGNSEMLPSQEAGASLSRQSVNVFADLFCMDDSNDEKWNVQLAGSAKKHKRKQGKPKICSTLSDSDRPCATPTSSQLQIVELDRNDRFDEDETAKPPLPSEVDAPNKVDTPSFSPERQITLEDTSVEQENVDHADSSKVGQNSEIPLSSRNEVFVIDTSVRGWRVEKIIIRKGSSWKIKDKCIVTCAGNLDSTVNFPGSKKRVRTSHLNDMKTEKSTPDRVRMQWKLGSISEKGDKYAEKPPIITEAWSTVPQTQLRSCRKRRKSAGYEDGDLISKKSQLCQDEVIEAVPEATIARAEHSDGTFGFPPDHPANQPKEALISSIYQVFMLAGKTGLTAREAVSRILEQGLPGLHEGGVIPRVEVLKIISNSPYFMLLEESKYILCSALVGDEVDLVGRKNDSHIDEQDQHGNGNESLDSLKSAKQCGISQYWAACAAIRRARTGKTRRKPSLGSCIFNPFPSEETGEALAGYSRKRRLKSLKQEVTGLGNRCNRSDGKGWHCPLRAKVGYLLCDHHLDRLRVKSHLKSKMFPMNKPSSEERKRTFGDSWMVKKVVERSRIGRHSIVASEKEAQNKVHMEFFDHIRSKDLSKSDRA